MPRRYALDEEDTPAAEPWRAASLTIVCTCGNVITTIQVDARNGSFMPVTGYVSFICQNCYPGMGALQNAVFQQLLRSPSTPIPDGQPATQPGANVDVDEGVVEPDATEEGEAASFEQTPDGFEYLMWTKRVSRTEIERSSEYMLAGPSASNVPVVIGLPVSGVDEEWVAPEEGPEIFERGGKLHSPVLTPLVRILCDKAPRDDPVERATCSVPAGQLVPREVRGRALHFFLPTRSARALAGAENFFNDSIAC